MPDEASSKVTLQFHKYDGAIHWRHDLVRLGADEHGIWLGAGPGSTMQRGSEPQIVARTAYVQLVVPDARWVAIFNAPGGKYEIYIDITTPAVWRGDHVVEMIDMDLDVVRHWNGDVELKDENEFAEHQVRYGYSPDLIAATEQAAQQVLADIEFRREPFGSAADPWLARVV